MLLKNSDKLDYFGLSFNQVQNQGKFRNEMDAQMSTFEHWPYFYVVRD